MRVVILGSGRGSNAAAILEAQQAGRLGRARVVHIFSDQPAAGILGLGARFGVAVGGHRVSVEGPPVAGRWVRLTGVIDEGPALRLRVDGEEVASAPLPGFLKGDPEEGSLLVDTARQVLSSVLPGSHS